MAVITTTLRLQDYMHEAVTNFAQRFGLSFNAAASLLIAKALEDVERRGGLSFSVANAIADDASRPLRAIEVEMRDAHERGLLFGHHVSDWLEQRAADLVALAATYRETNTEETP